MQTEGAYAFTDRFEVFVPPISVSVKDTTGAGDAFCGSFLYNLYINKFTAAALNSISPETLQKFVSDSNRYCAQSVQSYGAIESYPSSL